MTDDTRDDRAEPTLPPDEQPTWSPPEEVTTPVPAAPVALAGDRPPVRSRLRWGIALLVSLLVVVIAGGAFYLVTAATPTSALLADVPGDALYYVELRADLPGSQRQALAELLSGFPGFADRSQLDAKLSESVDKLLLRATDGKYDYSTQIKPWFAGQLAVAVPNLPASGNAASGVPTHLLVLATDLADLTGERRKPEPQKAARAFVAAATEAPPAKRRMTFKDKHALETLPKTIAALRAQAAKPVDCTAAAAAPAAAAPAPAASEVERR